MKRRNGFTLVELLVVIAIIGLLIAILVPSLARVRKRARAVLCSTNERGLVDAYRMYVQENKAVLSSTGHNGLGAWDFQLLAQGANALAHSDPANPNSPLVPATPTLYYTNNGLGGTMDKFRFCPETASARRQGNSSVGSATLTWDCHFGPGGGSTGSYAMNNWLYDPRSLTGGPGNNNSSALPSMFYPLLRLAKESVVPVFTESVWHDVVPRETDTAAMNTQNPGGNAETGNRSLADVVVDRHSRAINVSFWDGHVEKVKYADVWSIQWYNGWTNTKPPQNLIN